MSLPSMRPGTPEDCAVGRHEIAGGACPVCGVEVCDVGAWRTGSGVCTLALGHEGEHRSMWIELDEGVNE